MIKDLKHKAKQEKYHNSIINFSHLLKGEQRETFIDTVSNYNLLLAAKCIMSAEANINLEKKLKGRAVQAAMQFYKTDLSVIGFLTLVELKEFENAVRLLNNIELFDKTHKSVVFEIFNNTTLDITLDFIIQLMTKDKKIVDYCINNINIVGKLDRKTFKKIQVIAQKLFLYKKYHLLIPLLNKLGVKPSIVLNDNIHQIIQKLSLVNKGYVVDYLIKIIYCYKITEYSDYQIAKEYLKRGRAGLRTSIRLIDQLQINTNDIIDIIEGMLVERKRNSSIKTALGLVDYYDLNINNIVLAEKIILTRTYQAIKIGISLMSEKQLKIHLEEIIHILYKIKTLKSLELAMNLIEKYDVEVNIDKYVKRILKNKNIKGRRLARLIISLKIKRMKNENLTTLIQSYVRDYDFLPNDFSKLLRSIFFTGKVKNILDYGAFIRINDYETDLDLFLHKQQITKQEISHPSEVLQKGQEIEFRIIGINQKNFRFNISCIYGK